MLQKNVKKKKKLRTVSSDQRHFNPDLSPNIPLPTSLDSHFLFLLPTIMINGLKLHSITPRVQRDRNNGSRPAQRGMGFLRP